MLKALIFLFVVSCNKPIPVIPEPEVVLTIGKCDKWERCLVSTTYEKNVWMHKPELNDPVCNKILSKNPEFASFVFKCERK
jgi:hypothetical protein